MVDNTPTVLVVGAGPGLGSALLQYFDRNGYQSVGLTRHLYPQNNNIPLQAAALDDPLSCRHAIDSVINQYGVPKVVIHNTAQLRISPFQQTTVADFQAIWQSMMVPAVTLAQAVIQPMAERGGGAFLVSGATASIRGGANFSAFASAKFALRGLTQSLAREYQRSGVHVAHVLLDGIIDTERSRELHSLDPAKMMKADDIASVYYQLAHQPESSWSHEIDLRPASETF